MSLHGGEQLRLHSRQLVGDVNTPQGVWGCESKPQCAAPCRFSLAYYVPAAWLVSLCTTVGRRVLLQQQHPAHADPGMHVCSGNAVEGFCVPIREKTCEGGCAWWSCGWKISLGLTRLVHMHRLHAGVTLAA